MPGHQGESNDGDDRKDEFRGDVERVGQDTERGKREIGVSPRTHHAPVQPGGHRPTERDYVGDRTAAQVEQEASSHAEAR
jgi:hypothetical protein